jgi:hypothetical protein
MKENCMQMYLKNKIIYRSKKKARSTKHSKRHQILHTYCDVSQHVLVERQKIYCRKIPNSVRKGPEYSTPLMENPNVSFYYVSEYHRVISNDQ